MCPAIPTNHTFTLPLLNIKPWDNTVSTDSLFKCGPVSLLFLKLFHILIRSTIWPTARCGRPVPLQHISYGNRRITKLLLWITMAAGLVWVTWSYRRPSDRFWEITRESESRINSGRGFGVNITTGPLRVWRWRDGTVDQWSRGRPYTIHTQNLNYLWQITSIAKFLIKLKFWHPQMFSPANNRVRLSSGGLPISCQTLENFFDAKSLLRSRIRDAAICTMRLQYSTLFLSSSSFEIVTK